MQKIFNSAIINKNNNNNKKGKMRFRNNLIQKQKVNLLIKI